MTLRRGDVVAVAVTGDYGRPRPDVIVQTDAFPDSHPSIVVCQMTSRLIDAAHFRVTIEPSADNGLRARSQIMADNPVTARRTRIWQHIGRLGREDMARLSFAPAFAMGLSD